MTAKTGTGFEYPAPSKKSGVIVHAYKLNTGKSEIGSLSQLQSGEAIEEDT